VLSALLADPSAWRLTDPQPARRPRLVPDLAAGAAASAMAGGLAVPAYGPDVS